MNRKVFYDTIRKSIALRSDKIVDGFEYILNEGVKRRTPLDKLAYITATAYWETGRTMQPVREFGGEKYLRSKRYYPYVGMGYVQLTWKANYEKATAYFRDVLGISVDFVADPKQLLKPEYAAIILFEGMEQGWFTGKALDDYLDGVDEGDAEDLREFSNARRIVNGVDKQVEIGQIALVIEKGLRAAGYPNKPSTIIIEEPVMPENTKPEPTVSDHGGPNSKANGAAAGTAMATAALLLLAKLGWIPAGVASDPETIVLLGGLITVAAGYAGTWFARKNAA